MPPVAGMLAAAHGATGHGTTAAQSVSASSLLVQMVIGLVVVVALIKLASRFMQGKSGRALGSGRRQGVVAVVGRQSLGKGVQVAVVTAAERTYLVGVTQQQVTMLGQLSPDDTTTATAAAAGGGADAAADGEAPAGVDLQLLRGELGLDPAEDDEFPPWKSALEQIRAKTVRRA